MPSKSAQLGGTPTPPCPGPVGVNVGGGPFSMNPLRRFPRESPVVNPLSAARPKADQERLPVDATFRQGQYGASRGGTVKVRHPRTSRKEKQTGREAPGEDDIRVRGGEGLVEQVRVPAELGELWGPTGPMGGRGFFELTKHLCCSFSISW